MPAGKGRDRGAGRANIIDRCCGLVAARPRAATLLASKRCRPKGRPGAASDCQGKGGGDNPDNTFSRPGFFMSPLSFPTGKSDKIRADAGSGGEVFAIALSPGLESHSSNKSRQRGGTRAPKKRFLPSCCCFIGRVFFRTFRTLNSTHPSWERLCKPQNQLSSGPCPLAVLFFLVFGMWVNYESTT